MAWLTISLPSPSGSKRIRYIYYYMQKWFCTAFIWHSFKISVDLPLMNSLFFSSSVADPHHKRKLGLLAIFTCSRWFVCAYWFAHNASHMFVLKAWVVIMPPPSPPTPHQNRATQQRKKRLEFVRLFDDGFLAFRIQFNVCMCGVCVRACRDSWANDAPTHIHHTHGRHPKKKKIKLHYLRMYDRKCHSKPTLTMWRRERTMR